MTEALFLLAAAAQDPTPASVRLMTPPVVAQPVRLALTPTLDGSIEDEEWDVLAGQTYFQWEPETLYWAGKFSQGEDAVVTLDQNADGWLVGDDNLEFRVSFRDGQPVLNVRRLDATDPTGPRWMVGNIINESVRLAAKPSAAGWELEAAYLPHGSAAPIRGQRLGVRMDSVPAGADLGDPFYPRPVTTLILQTDVGHALPPGFRWRPDALVRSVPVEENFKIKYNFDGADQAGFSQLSFRSEGGTGEKMATGERPFPAWDRKGRASFEYQSPIAQDTPAGYRIVRVTLKKPDGTETVLRSSVKIAELVEFEIRLPKELPLSPDARIVRGSVVLRSNGLRRINGDFKLTGPEEWTVTKGHEANVTIYHSRGSQRIGVEFIVPKDTVGVFPLNLECKIGEKTVRKTVFLPIGER